MRLFLVAVGMLALAGCRQGGSTEVGAVRVEVFYATFRPGCLTVTVRDEADESRTETRQLAVLDERSATKTVAVFRQEDWSRDLRVTASAHERSCSGPVVDTSTEVVEVPRTGTAVVNLDLRAEDLDGDGFVSAKAGRGTDCDDDDAQVYPGAAETCDGVDSNCSGDESDATDKSPFYFDLDRDGYGDPLQMTQACTAPAGWVALGGDCHDGDASVHPGQAELRCDGRDDNCNGPADEGFDPGSSCETELGCAGTRLCSGDKTTSLCVSAQSPTEWFVDRDGDGRAGTSVGLSCKMPAGAVAVANDCDDGARFVGGAEECDRLDNDCNGQVDEGVCTTEGWTARTGLDESATWEAVAAWAPGKVWLAGAGGQLAHVDGSTVTSVTGCAGNWKSAWARPSDGRVFLGSAQGVLATLPVGSGTTCDLIPVDGVTSAINGLMGFERDGVTRVYGVTSSGHVLRWEWRDAASPQSEVVVVDQVAANLRAVHGLDEDTLLAVGAEDFQVTGGAQPRVFRWDVDLGRFVRESLPAEVGTGYLRGVYKVEAGLAHAVGDGGLVLEYKEGAWRKLSAPGGTETPDLLDVVSFGPRALLVLSNQSGAYLHEYDGATWTTPYPQGQRLLGLDALGPREQWAAGQGGTLLRWGP